MKRKAFLYSMFSITLFLGAIFLCRFQFGDGYAIQSWKLSQEQIAPSLREKQFTEKKDLAQSKTMLPNFFTHKNETYGYEFRYSKNYVIAPISTDKKVILAHEIDDHWQIEISIEPNMKNFSLDEVFKEATSSLGSEKEVVISDLLVDYIHAKKYVIQNPSDFGNTGIIFIKDKNIVTIFGEESNLNGNIVSNLNTILSSFHFNKNPLREDFLTNYSPYLKESNKVYFINQFDELIELPKVDIESFQFIGSCGSLEMSSAPYAKDKNHVYINESIAQGIDPGTFKYFGIFYRKDSIPQGISISKDKNHVYFGCGKATDSVRKESFKILKDGYSKDSKQVYYLDSILFIADNDSFEVIGALETNDFNGSFAVDKNNVYYQGQLIKNISPKNCKLKGLKNCLPQNWHDLLEDQSLSLNPLFSYN